METNQNSTSHPKIQPSFWLSKIFSFFGLFPLGIYVLVHLYNNLISLQGETPFNQHLAASKSLPFIAPIAILAIWIPIAFHGIYGLFIMKRAKPNLMKFRYFGNLKYILQRLSGIGLLLFIPAHIFKTRIDPYLSQYHLDFHHMAEGLHEPVTLIVYLLGVLGVAYHLSNGFWQFCIGWGITTSVSGMKRVEILSFILFALILGMGYGAIWGFYRSLV